MIGITTDPRKFVLTRFPAAKCHRLSNGGHVWYAITLNGSDVSIISPPSFGGRDESHAWRRLALAIMEFETVVGSLEGRAVR